jgi:hypothetical protein
MVDTTNEAVTPDEVIPPVEGDSPAPEAQGPELLTDEQIDQLIAAGVKPHEMTVGSLSQQATMMAGAIETFHAAIDLVRAARKIEADVESGEIEAPEGWGEQEPVSFDEFLEKTHDLIQALTADISDLTVVTNDAVARVSQKLGLVPGAAPQAPVDDSISTGLYL